MTDIDLRTYVYALFILMISSILSYLFIIHKLRNDKYPDQSLRFFYLYFISGVIGWTGHWLIETGILERDYTASLIAYMIVTMLLLQAIAERSSLNRTFKTNITIHVIAIIGSLLMRNETAQLLYHAIYSAVAYPTIVYMSFKRAHDLKNIGYGIIGCAALLVTILVPFQLYGALVPDKFNVGYAATLIGSSTGFVLVGIGFLSSMLINERAQLTAMTLEDPLTGLLNRRGLYQTLNLTLPSIERNHACMSAIAIDIDHFKKINDKYGHDTGDQVLKELARELKRHARGSDACCRVGGEEFVIILPDTAQSEAMQVAERIRKNIESDEINHYGNTIRITASFGVATLCNNIDLDHLLKQADNALYEAKSEGRNRVIGREIE